jgi:hypothetical protein
MSVGLVIGVAAIAAVPLWRNTRPGVISDILVHSAMSVEIVESGSALSYSIWYPIIYVFTAGGNPELFQLSSVILLSGFVALKAVIIYFILRHGKADAWTSMAVAFGLSFAAPWVDPNAPSDIYLGQISATVWHNSTNIVAAPFALVAFWFFIRLLARPRAGAAALAGAAIVLSVLAKPNFAIALLPVAGIFLLIVLVKRQTEAAKSVSILCFTFVPAVAVLIMQYLIVFTSATAARVSSGGLEINPFVVWEMFSGNLILSLVLSLSGILLGALVLIASRAMSTGARVSLMVLLLAVAQFALLSESVASERFSHGNWFWGSHTALLVAFVWLIVDLQLLSSEGKAVGKRWWARAAILIIATHAVSGIYYALVVGTDSYGPF